MCPPDRGDKLDPVKAAALGRGIPVHQFPSLKTAEARAAFSAARRRPGACSRTSRRSSPSRCSSFPRQTAICFHPSLLPRYRGGSAIPWQLIRGETRSGVTVFWPDAGIDTGPILLQREAPVGPDDTAGTLYYKTLFPLGVQTVLDSVALDRRRHARRASRRTRPLATYDPLLADAHAAIDWARPQQAVHDLIRGCDPQPGAHTVWRGTRLRLFEPRRVDGPRAPPGTRARGRRARASSSRPATAPCAARAPAATARRPPPRRSPAALGIAPRRRGWARGQ